ncbi:MAG: Sir2 family NAD-dependent protein deacetylase [Singulisphaera sp.]
MADDNILEQAADWIRAAREILVFTGAGISAESGIPTFRDDSGLWQNFPPEHFATWQGLLDTAARHPRRLAEFLNAVLSPIASAAPNAAHRALADAERHVGIQIATQNVDRLHQDAGSTCVYEIHGSFFEIVSREREFLRFISRAELRSVAAKLARAATGHLSLARVVLAIRPLAGLGVHGLYQPHLVLFGDMLAEPACTQSLAAARESSPSTRNRLRPICGYAVVRRKLCHGSLRSHLAAAVPEVSRGHTNRRSRENLAGDTQWQATRFFGF